MCSFNIQRLTRGNSLDVNLAILVNRNSMKALLKRLIIKHSIAQITVAISLLIIGASVGITLADSWLFNHPLMPTIYLAVLVPALVSPPVSYVLVYLIQHLDDAEKQLLERESRLQFFVADVAHELRTPLSILRLRLDEIEDKEISQSLHYDIEKMSHLVEQLLALARMDTLSVSVDDDAELCEVCTKVATRLAPLAIKKKRSIEVVGASGPVKVHGNSSALEQAVYNLAENAIKYSARETTITLKVGDDATISVIDHGRGVPLEMRSEIFDRFLRSDQRSSGSGLGLSIVQQIIDVHDGSIEVFDTPGGGATFTISLTKAIQ